MTTISLVATDQLLSVAIQPKVASGDQNSVKLHVDFDSKWDSYGKSAVFYTEDNGTIYEMVLTDGNCVIPHEVLAKPGILYIGIRGVNADNNAIKTSSLVKYKIAEGAPVGDGTTVEPTANVYQQILTAYEAERARVDKLHQQTLTEVGVERARVDKLHQQTLTEVGVERARIDELVAMRGDSTVKEYTSAVIVEADEYSEQHADGICTFKSNGYSAAVEVKLRSLCIISNSMMSLADIPEEFLPLQKNNVVLSSNGGLGLENVNLSISQNMFSPGYTLYLNNNSQSHINIASTDLTFAITITASYPLKNTVIPELADLRVGFNDTTYATAGEAVRAQVNAVTKEIDYVTGHIETVKSNETKITNFIYNRNISAGESLSFFIHDFTHLKRVEFYIQKGDGTREKIGGCGCEENYWMNLEAYSEDVTFNIYATVSDDIGSNTAYFTVSVYENRDGNLNQRLLTVEQENVAQNESIAKCEKNVERLFSRNIYCGEVIDGGYYDDGGVWVTSNSFRCAVLPVNSVVNGDRIIYSKEFAYYNGQFRFDAFSEDGTWLGKIYNGKNTSFIVNGVQSNKFYLVIRIGAKKDVANLFVAIDGNIKSAVLKGKTINCLGDSFTAPVNGWHKHLAERTGIVCNNYGVASSRITIDSGEAGSFLNRYQNMDNTADVTIIFGGINDSRSMFDDGVNDTIQLGSMDSDLDNTTFYGGLRLLIESIKAFMPGKKILGVIPPDFEQTTPYLTYLPQVRTACREVYEYYGIPYADLKKNCQEMYIDDYNFLTYRRGGVNDYHPSEAGHVAISEIIQGELERFWKV